MEELQTPTRICLELHPAQREIHASDARFRVASTGRRFGKTTLAVGELVVHAAQNPGSVLWWVAPVYQQSQIAFKMLLEMLPPSTRVANRSDREVLLWNGSVIAFKSADRPDNLRGEGVSFLVVDEAAYIKAETWQAALRPTLSDTGGRALLVSTFRGENFLYDLYRRGQDDEYAEWESWRFPTSANPHIPASEIAEAQRTLPHAVFEQEYMANPLVYKGAVFSGELVETARRPVVHDAELPTYAGLDWGYTNPTALVICQEHQSTGEIRWLEESLWYSVELNKRCQAIADTCERLGIRIVFADAAGKSENVTLAALFEARGMKVVLKPVAFNRFKSVGIATRRWYLEAGLESLGNVPELIADSKRYRYKEDQEEVDKVDDHTVDAATAFYSARRHVLRRDADTLGGV